MQLTPRLSLNVSQQHLYDDQSETRVELSYAETAALSLLGKHQDVLVTKDALLEAGWPDRVVSPASIQQCISVLRKKLTDYPEIELKTIPRHGYILHVSKLIEPEKPKRFLSAPIVFGILLVMCAVVWGITYFSQGQPFTESKVVSILSGATGSFTLFSTNKATTADAANQRLHNQISDESQWQAPFQSFSGYAKLTESLDSFAICPDYSDSQCSGKQLINISGEQALSGHLLLSDFLTTKIRMEQKTYNKLDIDELKHHSGELSEQLYHGDLYFSIGDNRLVRSDMRLSLVNLAPNSGIFYFAACVTDEDCYTSPTKYQIRGHFSRSIEKWQQRKVERFDIEISDTELASPTTLSDTAQRIYLKFRKQDLTHAPMTFYRLYQDDKTAVWQMQDNIIWMQRQTLKL